MRSVTGHMGWLRVHLWIDVDFTFNLTLFVWTHKSVIETDKFPLLHFFSANGTPIQILLLTKHTNKWLSTGFPVINLNETLFSFLAAGAAN